MVSLYQTIQYVGVYKLIYFIIFFIFCIFITVFTYENVKSVKDSDQIMFSVKFSSESLQI